MGRRPTLSGGLIIGGLACLITGLVPEGTVLIAWREKELRLIITCKIFFFRSTSNSIRILFGWKILYFGCLRGSLFLHRRTIPDENKRHFSRNLFYYRYLLLYRLWALLNSSSHWIVFILFNGSYYYHY